MGRSSWGESRTALADQVVVSATNFAAVVLVARAVSAEQFGYFALALALGIFIQGLSQAIGSEPFMIRFAHADRALLGDSVASVLGLSLVVGCAGASFLGVAALLFHGAPQGRALAAMGAVVPFLAFQASARYLLVGTRRASAALGNDVAFGSLQIIGLATVTLAVSDPKVWELVLAWGFAAAVTSVLGWRQLRVTPGVRAGVRWFRTHRDLTVRTGTEHVVLAGSSQVALILIAVFTTPIAVGAIRAMSTAFGPINVAFSSLGVSLMPYLTRARDAVRASRETLRVGSALAALVAFWSIMLALAGSVIGPALFGATWAEAETLLPAFAAQYLALAVYFVTVVVVKARQEAQVSLRVRTSMGVATIIGAAYGGYAGGAVGAAWGLAVAAVIGAGLGVAGLVSTRHRQPGAAALPVEDG